MNTIPVITIDGPTASGKGTIAQRVAHTLGFHYLDSGALYRLVALSSLRQHIAPTGEPQLAQLAHSLPCSFSGDQIFLSQENVTTAIRAETIGNIASQIASLPAVRHALYERQRQFQQPPGLVADGRDMGTVIFPDAPTKVFLTASVEARAKRRYKQLIEKGFSANIADLSKDLIERDARDTHRAIAPLRPAEGAYLLDTSDLTIEQTVKQVLDQYAFGVPSGAKPNRTFTI